MGLENIKTALQSKKEKEQRERFNLIVQTLIDTLKEMDCTVAEANISPQLLATKLNEISANHLKELKLIAVDVK